MTLLIVLLVVLFVFGGGGAYWRGGGYTGSPGLGIFGLIVAVLVILLLVDLLTGVPIYRGRFY